MLIVVSIVIKTMKAVSIIMLFGFNGTHNDFFVLYFFMASNLCGIVYLSHCGFEK